MTTAGDVDYYGIEELLTPEERMTTSSVRSFVEREALPVIEDCHAREEFPRQLIPRMAELGMFGAHLKGYGCAGLSAVAYGLICQELEAGDSGLRSMASVQGSLAMYSIWRWGTEEQKRRWLPEMAAGRAIGCFGLTEPDHGSDPGGMETRARRDGAHWILGGTKRWITNGSIADVATVWAKDDEGAIRGFLVERGTPGFSAHDIKGKFSLRASITSELVLEEVRVPASAILPEARGLSGPFSCLNQARYGIVWGAIGAARTCYLTALDYARARTQFGKPLASFQLVQAKLADMATELRAARLLVYSAARLKDAGAPRVTLESSMAKLFATEMAHRVIDEAVQIHGGAGVLRGSPIERLYREARAPRIYEGTSEIQRLIIARQLLKD